MADDRKLPAPPVRGMIEIDGKLHIRRYGLIAQRELTCIYGHRIKVDGRPFEIALPCLNTGGAYRFDMPQKERCQAQLYILNTRARLLWAMDLTHAESTIIDNYSLDVDKIIDYFGVGFPADMKIARLSG
jgi:hypothetical protein